MRPSPPSDVGAAAYPFVPVRWFIKDAFHSDRRIARVHAPILALHGERDNIVPIRFAERLFALAGEPKRFVRYRQGNHVDLDDYGAMDEVRKFLGGLPALSSPGNRVRPLAGPGVNLSR